MFSKTTRPVTIAKATPKDTEEGRKIDLKLALQMSSGEFGDVADDLGDAIAVFDENDDPMSGLDALKYISPLGVYNITFAEQPTAFDEQKFTLSVAAVDLGKEIVVERLADSDGVRWVATVKCQINRTSKTAQYFLHDHHGHKVYCRMELVKAAAESGHLPQEKLDLDLKKDIAEDATRLLCIGVLKALAIAQPAYSFESTNSMMHYLEGAARDAKGQLAHIRKLIKQLEKPEALVDDKHAVRFGAQKVALFSRETGEVVRDLAWQPLFEALTNRHISVGELQDA